MAYKIVNDDSLTSVANAIRVQGSISGTLEFPDGFVSAIQNLSPSPTLQTKTKTYTPTTSQQTESVTADSGYDGLSEVDVTVNAIPSQYKDTTDATATADKILSGYTAYANGQKLTGTASGGITPSGTISITQNGQVDVTNYATADVNVSGGGGGLEYESGTYTPTENVARPTINFSNSHSNLPICVMIVDSASSVPANSLMSWSIFNWYSFNGHAGVFASTSYYGRVQYLATTSSSLGLGGSNITALTGEDNSSLSTWLTTSSFSPYTGSTSRYFRTSQTYKWIAIWV